LGAPFPGDTRDFGPDRDCAASSRVSTVRVPGSDSNTHTNADTYTYADEHANPNAYVNADEHADSNTYTDSNEHRCTRHRT